MIEHNLKSPLLNDMTVLSCLHDANGIATYLVKSLVTEKTYIFKVISIPESQTHVDGLRYSGAIRTAGDAQEYYARVADGYKTELEAMKAISACGSLDCFPSWHIQPKEEGVGFDIHLLNKHRKTLVEFAASAPMTQAAAVSLALDLSRSMMDLRSAGRVHCNVKPSNIYLDSSGHFILGGLGTFPTEELRFAAVPERMLGRFAAPELFDVLQQPNATVDTYALGLILYNIYNGGHGPLEDEETTSRDAQEKRIRGVALPPPLYADYEMSSIILKACAYSPADRYQTPAELFEALQDYIQRNSITDAPIVPPLVTDDDMLLGEDALREEMQPMHFAKAEDLEDDFVHHFAPDAAVLTESIDAVQNAAEKNAPDADDEVAAILRDFHAQENGLDTAETAENPEGQKAEEKKKKPLPRWIWIAALIVILAGIGVGIYFLLVPGVRDCTVVASDSGSISVSIDSAYPVSAFSAVCVDSFGNSYPGTANGKNIDFTDLHPGTQYTIRLRSARGGTIRGKRSYIASTSLATKVEYFVAKPITETKVELSFDIEGTDQQEWSVVYRSPETAPEEVKFTGHSVVIGNLAPNCLYTFTLQNSEEVSLSGFTQVQYDTTIHVEIGNIHTRYAETGVVLTWNYTGRPPQAWSVLCTDENGKTTELSTAEAQIAIDVLEVETDYTIEIFCSGMSSAASTKVRRDVPGITDYSVTAHDNGNISVLWACDEEVPDGWVVKVYQQGKQNVLWSGETEGNRLSISGLLPNTAYDVVLTPKNGWTVSGTHSATVTTADIGKFSAYNLTNTYIGLFKHSGKAQWGVGDLLNFGNPYKVGESIVFALQPLTKIEKSESEVVATAALRNADGELVRLKSEQRVWNDLWDQNLWLGDFTNLDLPAGKYSLELYFNNAYVNKIPIEIR